MEAEGSSRAASTKASYARCRLPLYAQVLVGISLGVLFGWLEPDLACNPWIKALGVAFVKMVKMVIAPIIFCTIVSGIAHVADAVVVGRVALKAVIYFEIVSSLALLIGLVVANVIRPGDGFSSSANMEAVEKYKEEAAHHTTLEFVMNIIPKSAVGAFAEADTLQVLFFAVLFGFALMAQGERTAHVRNLIDEVAHVMFGTIRIIMRFAPVAAFGAIAFTVGKYGIATLGNLLKLVITFYLTSLCFVFLVLGGVCALYRVNIFRLLLYIKQELLLVVATSSSECVLPQLMEKLECLGVSKPVVGLVVPLGYSFNLDGTNIYMTLATLFISQALGVELSISEQLEVLLVAMLTSKGAAAVSGGGFIILASTLGSVRPALVPGMAMLLGVDKFMAECRSITNLIGNTVATVVVAASEADLNREQMDQVLLGEPIVKAINSDASSAASGDSMI
eukprot:TRINITY_DN25531_c0_g1_i1.p1 TRINITY_DN25531_c0_g1~~TRINITY_DN25531_c0_g1_i1.p1  ORF type:complete len:451 (-),score=77.37 TRINITY_DN25531_c0_g1_i1:336-1688(-)